MEGKQLKSLNRLSADQLQKKLDNGEFTANQRPIIVQMIKTKRGSHESEELASSADAAAPAAEGTIPTAPEAPAAPAPGKKKPGETTYTIEAFTGNAKGIKAGTVVSFTQSNKGTGPVIEGTVQRVFRWFEKDREEAKIKGTDGKRYYRFEKDLTPVVKDAAPAAPAAPEAPAEDATEPQAAE